MIRPTKFAEVIGQEIAIKLIKNALKLEKLPHTIILHGPSGVGKTTLARLIAAWFVCTNKTDDVCGQCQMCKSIQNGTIPDVLEFDAASNTGVDDIREILDQCKYAPQYSKEKIFIMDEAHMLSRNAISALLKTFEETQEHVRFILATTEMEKIPNAIQSRCFCIPLYEVNTASIEKQLSFVAQNENFNYEKEALEIIAAFAQGSLREAMSIFYQAKIFGQINQENVYKIIGCVKDEIVNQIISDMINGKFIELFELLTKVTKETNIPSTSLLKQIVFVCTKNFQKYPKKAMIKILIDLNKLLSEIGKNFSFSEGIIIGLTTIAYEIEKI